MPHTRKVSACRREQKSMRAAEPRTAEHLARQQASLTPVESVTTFGSHLGGGNEKLERQRVEGCTFKQSKDRSPPCSLGLRFCVGRKADESQASLVHSKLCSSAARCGRRPNAALPNPSLKLSPNGGPRGPGRRYPVHSRQPGPRVPPLVPT